ncbi:MAG: tetratricopeptide repeat protein [Tannerellaceae bacterium]|jgi:pentatricopeptide repeat protein|nr:tetratricopeptide repeat protein [Tannerellaceae bacterium]
MKKSRITLLRERFISAKENRKEPYFDTDEIDDLLESLEDEGDYDLYDEVLVLGMKLHPENTDLLIRKCRQLLIEDEIDKALALIRQIGEGGNPDLDVLELECYIYSSDYTKVIELTESLIARKVDYLDFVFECIAPALNDMEMFDEAIVYAEKGLRLFPESIILKEELCFSLENTEDFDRAITVCNELIDKKPYSFDEWFSLGRLYCYKGNYDSAIEAFDFALACDNDSIIELNMLLAYCLCKNGNFTRAIEIFKEALSDAVYKERVIALLADCYIKMNDLEAAYKLLKDTVNESPDTSLSIYIQLMGCCIEMERFDEAYEVLTKAHLVEPDSPELNFLQSYLSKDKKSGKELLTEMFEAMTEIIDLEDLLDMEDLLDTEEGESLMPKRAGKLKDSLFLTKSLAREYIKNKENSN